MQRLLDLLSSRRERTAFPGQVRILAAPEYEASLAARGWTVEWPGADAAEAIAGLAGVAFYEHARGGLAVALINGACLSDGTAMSSLITVARLGVPCVLAVVAPDASQRALVVAAGWTWGDGQQVNGPVAVAIEGESPAPAIAVCRGRWAPLRLPAVRAWSHRVGDPLADLAELSQREPRVLLAHVQMPWRDVAAGQALLAALAAVAGEGRRVVWHVPASLTLQDMAPTLRRMSERGRSMILVVDAFDSSSIAFWGTLPGWWVAVPADAAEYRAVLARAVASDDLMVIAKPMTGNVLTWPDGTAHEAGSGRWLFQPQEFRATIVCAGACLTEVLRAREALAVVGIPIAIYHVTSVQPLPDHDLRFAAELGPLVVVDDGDSSLGLAGAIARTGIALRELGNGPLAGDMAEAIRSAL